MCQQLVAILPANLLKVNVFFVERAMENLACNNKSPVLLVSVYIACQIKNLVLEERLRHT